MTQALIIGQANVGKTLFFVNFCDFLGVQELELALVAADGSAETAVYSPRRARQTLVGSEPHTTRTLQSAVVELRRGKGRHRLEMMDSSGLIDGIHEDQSVRRAMAQTLRRLQEVDLVLHMVDASKVGVAGAPAAMGTVDREIIRYSPLKATYTLLANKIDLPWARSGLKELQGQFDDVLIIPVSALQRRGFREVKAFVYRALV